MFENNIPMIAVITGDVVNSRSEPTLDWLPTLKETLSIYGRSSSQWEIFRGDSFQIKTDPKMAFQTAIHIKAAVKLNKNLDVRMAIGIGNEDHKAEKITESNGSAFVRSGECFENLKKHHLAISTGNENTDEILNLCFSLALFPMNNWSATVANAVKITLENSEKSQTQIARLLKKSQSSVSEALKRGGFEEILQLNEFYQKQISQL